MSLQGGRIRAMSLQTLLWKDVRRELRSKESIAAGLVLVGLFFVLYIFALTGLVTDRMATIALWTPLVFSAAAIAGRGLAAEADRGTLALLRLAPVPTALHGAGRTIVDAALMAMLATATYALAMLGFNMEHVPRIWLILVLAVLGLSIVGALTGGLAAQARSREILAPLLLIPVAAPLIQAGVIATLDALAGVRSDTALLIMIGYDLVLAGATWLLWPYVLEAD